MILVIIAFGVGHYIKNTHYLDKFTVILSISEIS